MIDKLVQFRRPFGRAKVDSYGQLVQCVKLGERSTRNCQELQEFRAMPPGRSFRDVRRD